MSHRPSITVIVPTIGDHADLRAVLEAVRGQGAEQVIVVIDGSEEAGAESLRADGWEVVCTGQRGGPASARNFAATHAKGEWLLFLDADTVPMRDLVNRLRTLIATKREYAGFFGSYDDMPSVDSLVSRYRNLLHHFHHQQPGETGTFWAGCGALKKTAFDAVGGFDAERYPVPSIEDIELGYRLAAAGNRVLLEPSLQVKHRKHWTFCNMVRTDVFQRAAPWTELILCSRPQQETLNVSKSGRIALVATVLMWGAFVLAWFLPYVGAVAALFALPTLSFHAGFLRFWARTQHKWELPAIALLLLVYQTCCAIGFVLGFASFLRNRRCTKYPSTLAT